MMGTNYYYHDKPPCECCKRPFEGRHIGKSSAGWCFSLHVYPDEGINTLDDWRRLFAVPEALILDEYGDVTTVEEMLSNITEREWPHRGEERSQQWLDQNFAVVGPNGLARHALYPGHCIGQGEGTWDYLIGDFS